MTAIIDYIRESFEELKFNVSWPTFSEGLSLTVLVAIFSIIFAVIIWALDKIFEFIVVEFMEFLNVLI
tara:strand:+ start:6653 stop:6856 length:204 start_codon:yes stop_codon:yes gene_type:complete